MAPTDRSPGTILVVDDNPNILSILTDTLTQEGYTVKSALSGELALKWMATNLADLILLDINMPEMDGYEVCIRLKTNSRTEAIPVIFISALDEPMDKIKAFAAGGVDYVTKPFQHEEVLARIDTHLALQQMQVAIEWQNTRLKEEIKERKKAEKNLQKAHDELEMRVAERTADLKKSEARLRQTQKMEALGTLAGGIAHDFNNILSGIIGYSELVMEELDSKSLVADNLAQVLQAGHRAKDLVKQILTFSRQSEQERKPINTAYLLKEAVKLMRASLPPTIKIQQNIQPVSGLILADPTQIHQVVLNLCTNAAQAMKPDGGLLTITLGEITVTPKDSANFQNLKAGAYQKITVADTGCGIKPSALEKIFEPYYTDKLRGEGTGLGLAVAHGIIKSHEGAITVQSNPCEGAIFNLYLPQIPGNAANEGNIFSPEPLPRGTESVLFIDDEVTLAELGGKMLTGLGYRVDINTSALNALTIIEASPMQFDLVVTDHMMPDMTGQDFALALKKTCPDLPVIICTGFSDELDREQIEHTGIREILMKPLLTRKLAETVRKVLDGRRAEVIDMSGDS